MGMCLEEGVQKGRLVKESVPTADSEKKSQEVSVMKGQPKQQPRQQTPRQFNP